VFHEVFNETDYSPASVLPNPGDLSLLFAEVFSRAKQANLRPEFLSQDPLVLYLKNFTTKEERETLIELTKPDMEKSQESGTEISDHGIPNQYESMKRTSSNSWCAEECLIHPVVKQVSLFVFIKA
jgi:hypothetical protein